MATCDWTGLAPGPYRLAIACPGTEPLELLDSIQVRDDEDSEDPRLLDIDLRGRVRSFTVTVTDPDGTPIGGGDRNDAGVMIRGDVDPQAQWRGQALARATGQAALLAPAPLDLIVFAPGFRTVELSAVFGDATLQLTPVPKVALRLATALPTLPAETAVELRASRGRVQGTTLRTGRMFDPRGGSSSNYVDSYLGRMTQSLRPEAGGNYVLDVRAGGSVELSLILRRRAEGQNKTWTVHVTPSTLDLDATRTDQVIEVTVDEASLQQALDEIGR
jgi:hypothetical protein